MIFQSDGYAAYDVFEDNKSVCLVGCLAHIRRHFESCLVEHREYAEYALKQIQNMYNVEKIADKDELSFNERTTLRVKLSKPILDAFELWLMKTYPKVLKRSLIGKA
jgi:hypothetical protein